ncbi:MAG: polysaccharide deacetylase family protein [Rhizobiaceae bacterium]|nr:polysaccharide deacetylase family protein [Rhizobiaceae bacterium]
MRDIFLKTTLNGLYFSGLQAMSAFWAGGVGAILMLHHVRDQSKSRFAPNHHLQIDPKFLEKVLNSAQQSGYEFVSLDQLHTRFVEKKLDQFSKMIAITLDDGYRDNLQNAVPIFRKFNAPYTIYIAPGLVDGRADLWWEDLATIIAQRDQIRIAMPRGHKEFDVSTPALKNATYKELLQWLTTKVSETEQRKIVRELAWGAKIDTRAHAKQQIMNWREINELSKDPLCTIGAHTIHHYALARLSDEDAEREIRDSANILKMELGESPTHFAYPYGYRAAAGPRDFEIARKLGFKTAVTTRHGVLHQEHHDNIHALPRISLNGNFQSVRYVDTLLSGLPTLIQNRGKKLNVS